MGDALEVSDDAVMGRMAQAKSRRIFAARTTDGRIWGFTRSGLYLHRQGPQPITY